MTGLFRLWLFWQSQWVLVVFSGRVLGEFCLVTPWNSSPCDMSLVHKSIFFFKLISDLVLGLLFFFSRLISDLGFFFLDLGFFCHVLIISRSRFQSWQSSFCLAPLFYPRLLFFFHLQWILHLWVLSLQEIIILRQLFNVNFYSLIMGCPVMCHTQPWFQIFW